MIYKVYDNIRKSKTFRTPFDYPPFSYVGEVVEVYYVRPPFPGTKWDEWKATLNCLI